MATEEPKCPPGLSDPWWALCKPITKGEIERWIEAVSAEIARTEGTAPAEARRIARRMLADW